MTTGMVDFHHLSLGTFPNRRRPFFLLSTIDFRGVPEVRALEPVAAFQGWFPVQLPGSVTPPRARTSFMRAGKKAGKAG